MKRENVIEWLINGEFCRSSATIAAHVLGVQSNNTAILYDKPDFRRCYELVKYAEIEKGDLVGLENIHPAWKNIIDNWDELCYRYEKDQHFSHFLKQLIYK